MKAPVEPSPEDVRAVADYVSERAGLSFAGRRGSQLLSEISRAMQRGGAPGGADYRSRLDRDGPDFDELIGRLTVGESYFFREPGQLDVLRQEILPERQASRDRGRVLQLWSAGCAQGEEPYTLAIVLEEAGVAPGAHILATDLSTEALGVAESGVYGPWALRATTERQREAYFHPVEGRYRIDERFRRLVTFRHHNLLEPGGPGLPPMDVIFCRNVLIYFQPPAVHRAAERLASSLAPGGWLVTGSSDPPLEVRGLEPVVTTAGVVYRRAVADRDRAGKPPRVQPVRQAEPRRSPAGTPGGDQAPIRRPPERAGPTAPASAPGHESAGPREAVDRIRSLGDAGDVHAAATAAGVAVEQYPLDVELRFLQAVSLFEAGRPAEAAAAARAVLYLEPTLVMAHLTLARAEQALGHRRAAHRSLRNAGTLLRALAPDAVVPLSGGEPAGRLAAMLDAHLRATGPDAGARH